MLRSFKRQLARERKHAEKLLDSLLLAMSARIGLAEERMLEKLDGIDTSVSLIAAELARRSSDGPSNDSGS
jgi:hypothetical protein